LEIKILYFGIKTEKEKQQLPFGSNFKRFLSL